MLCSDVEETNNWAARKMAMAHAVTNIANNFKEVRVVDAAVKKVDNSIRIPPIASKSRRSTVASARSVPGSLQELKSKSGTPVKGVPEDVYS